MFLSPADRGPRVRDLDMSDVYADADRLYWLNEAYSDEALEAMAIDERNDALREFWEESARAETR